MLETECMTEHPLQHLGLDALSYVWPAACLGCGRPDRDWCAACRQAFHSSHDTMHLVPRGHITRRWCASGVYEGPRRTLIRRLKHDGQLRLARHLGAALRVPLAHLMSGLTEEPLIIPMPSRSARVRERGYRHLECVLGHTGLECTREGRRILRATPGRTGQVGLDERARERNAARLEVRAGARVAGRTVILIDDIVTTGATLASADARLTEAGARVVGAAVIATAERRDVNFDKNVH